MVFRLVIFMLALSFLQPAVFSQGMVSREKSEDVSQEAVEEAVEEAGPQEDVSQEAAEEATLQEMVSTERSDDVSQEADEDGNYLEEWSSINDNQPIAEGGKIYAITSMEKKSVFIEKGRYRKERIWKTKKYVYDDFVYGSIKIVYTSTDQYDIEDSMVRYDSGLGPKGRSEIRTDSREIIIPLNNRRQASLETIDGKTLIITVVGRSNKITVEEK